MKHADTCKSKWSHKHRHHNETPCVGSFSTENDHKKFTFFDEERGVSAIQTWALTIKINFLNAIWHARPGSSLLAPI